MGGKRLKQPIFITFLYNYPQKSESALSDFSYFSIHKHRKRRDNKDKKTIHETCILDRRIPHEVQTIRAKAHGFFHFALCPFSHRHRHPRRARPPLRQERGYAPARIVIRVEGVEQSLTEGIASGERVIDRTHRRLLGTVSEIRRTPQVTEIAPTSGEETVLCERVGLVDLDLVLIPDHDHSGYFVTPRVWSVGTTLTFATPSFAATGTIIRVER